MYDLTLGQNGHFNKKANQKNHVSFMPHAFSHNEHSFDQCGHFSQVEPFEKPRFFIMTTTFCILKCDVQVPFQFDKLT